MPRLLLLKHNIITHHAQFSVFDVVCQSTINACQADTESDQWRIQGWSSDTALILLVALEGDSFNMFFLEWAPRSYWSPTSRGRAWTFSGRDSDTKLSGSVYVYTKELPHRVGEMCFSDNQYVYCMSHHWVFVFLLNLPDRNKELYCAMSQIRNVWRSFRWQTI